MRSIILFLACSCVIIAISCKKNNQPSPAISHETKKVQLKLTGDILITESPLYNGRKGNGNDLSGAKNYGNNTLYAVFIRTPGDYVYTPFYTGLFSHPDSIYINVPTSGQFYVSVGIYKKGTGSGLYYTLENGLKYFDYPISTALRNRMDTVTGYPHMTDSVALVQLADPADTTRPLRQESYPEVEYFQGDTTFTGSPNPAPISINVKRRSFGIKLSATNFSGGELTAKFFWNSTWGPMRAAPITVTPATINSQYHILAADEFRTSDSTWPIIVQVIWTKPDNSQEYLGEKTIYFKRNVLTTLHITMASTGRASIDPQITETDWSGNETINF